MKKFISLMNSQSFYYLWQNKTTRKYLESIIFNIINQKDKYKLLNTFNYQNEYLRSYIFLESKKNLILIDFNFTYGINKTILNQDLIKFLKLTVNKEIIMILFHDYQGKNKIIDNQYFIYQNKNNSNEIKLLLSKTIKKQKEYDYYGIINYLDSLDDQFYLKYLKEYEKEENIYNLIDL